MIFYLQARSKGQASWAAARDANPYGALRRHCNNRKYVAIKLRFIQTRQNFSENYPRFRHAPSKIFAISVLCRKILKNIGLKGRKIISLHGRHKFLEPALFFSYKIICLGEMIHKNVCRLASGSGRVLNPRYTLNTKDKIERYLKNIDTGSSVNILTAVDFEDHFGQSVCMIYLPLSHFAFCVYLIC